MMFDTIAQFHFLRPLWLLALIAVAVLWLAIRPRHAGFGPQAQGIAAHLARALNVDGSRAQRVFPIDLVMLAATLLVLAVAGPAWTRAPNPLVADTAPLVVALKVTPSMQEQDLAPTRLDRAKFKILDLIDARAGARTALVAYAGTPHRVAPLTEDPNILRPLLEGLVPEVMPVTGDAADDALTLSTEILSDAGTAGAILFVLDDMDPGQVDAFAQSRQETSPQILFLTALPDDRSLPQIERIPGAIVIPMTANDADVVTIERRVKSAYAAALAGDDRLEWEDRGWLFAWPAALLVLLWFRRGWTMRWVLLLWAVLPAAEVRAEGWRDWFLTPDQQGQIAYDRKEYARAADLFEDTYLRGHAQYKAGQYSEAASTFDALDTPEAAFAAGMARIRNREYRPAIAAFETALDRKPGWPEAEHNLEVTRAILDYVETAREQSDTGEEAGIGADDVVFDNEAGRGTETEQDYSEDETAGLSAEQWISSIDTDMTGFLRSRFLLENQERSQ